MRVTAASMDRLADLIAIRIFERMADAPGASAVFDHWREAFGAARRHPHEAWIQAAAEGALEELLQFNRENGGK